MVILRPVEQGDPLTDELYYVVRVYRWRGSSVYQIVRHDKSYLPTHLPTFTSSTLTFSACTLF